ncbi:MAG: AAA family ATPase, partial [Nanoarchaeota archaeon]|nr:AAA family ATPase [Nanoarchaeota archaeon]
RKDYEKIFLAEPLGFTEKTAVRRESNEEALRLGRKIEQIYRGLGYEIVSIPKGKIEERVKKVLENL